VHCLLNDSRGIFQHEIVGVHCVSPACCHRVCVLHFPVAAVLQHNLKRPTHRFCSSPQELITDREDSQVLIPEHHPPHPADCDLQASGNRARRQASECLFFGVRNEVDPLVVASDQPFHLVKGDRRLELESDGL